MEVWEGLASAELHPEACRVSSLCVHTDSVTFWGSNLSPSPASISLATLDAALKLSAECNHAFQDFLQIKLHSEILEANPATHEWGILLILLILVFKAYLEITISLCIFI